MVDLLTYAKTTPIISPDEPDVYGLRRAGRLPLKVAVALSGSRLLAAAPVAAICSSTAAKALDSGDINVLSQVLQFLNSGLHKIFDFLRHFFFLLVFLFAITHL